jgi:hypothetical protein
MDARVENLVERAKDRLAAGDPYGAIHILREVTASGRGFADAHHLLGLAHWRSRRRRRSRSSTGPSR